MPRACLSILRGLPCAGLAVVVLGNTWNLLSSLIQTNLVVSRRIPGLSGGLLPPSSPVRLA